MLENLNYISLGKISQQTIASYKDSVPKNLLEIWEDYGVGKFYGGLIWLVEPQQWVGTMLEWVPHLNNSVAFARTAFGCVYLYHEGTTYYLDVLEKDLIPIWGNLEMLFEHFFQDDIYLEDILDKKLFEEAVTAYGELSPHECFGFHPALSFGGTKDVKKIKKVAIREHLHILLHL